MDPLLPRLPLAPTYNSSNPFLGSSNAGMHDEHEHDQEQDEPTSAEKPLRDAVAPRSVVTDGRAGVARAVQSGAGAASIKRERLRSDSSPVPPADAHAGLVAAGQGTAGVGNENTPVLSLPRRRHAARRRDLQRYLEADEEVTPRRVDFGVVDEAMEQNEEQDADEDEDEHMEQETADEAEDRLVEEEAYRLYLAEQRERDENPDVGESDDDEEGNELAIWAAAGERQRQAEHDAWTAAHPNGIEENDEDEEEEEPEEGADEDREDANEDEDDDMHHPPHEPSDEASVDSWADLTPSERDAREWAEILQPRATMWDVVVKPKPETFLPGWEPPSPAGPGHGLGPSEDLYNAEMGGRDWTVMLDTVEDIRKVNDGVKGWGKRYRIVDRLGEGTFSSVYKAIDIKHERYDNAAWTEAAGVGPHGRVFVALKRIYVTSSPERIANELEIMEELRGCRQVIQLISAHRHNDQVFAVMPFHNNDDYRLFYRHLDPAQMRAYFRCLFLALADTHERGIIHRDVKPANFLFDYRTGNGVLVDFGLAERYEIPSRIQCQHSHSTSSEPHGHRMKTSATDKVEAAFYEAARRANLPEGRVGFVSQDTRPSIKANRAGTRGFRAPEVLLKCPDQTYAIDVWAAGIVLLSVLTHKFPVFNSNDDVEALMEIGTLVGMKTLSRCAILHNLTLISNVPALREERAHQHLEMLIQRLNPRVYTPPDEKCSREEAREHIESIDSAMDLLHKLLIADHTKRWTARQALQHPFLKQDN